MKFIIMILFLLNTLFSADLKWSNDYKQALIDAKKQDKLVYVFITSDTCRWCRKFEATTLQDKDILKRLHKEFITIQLSRDRDEIPSQFQTAPVPRHYFTDAQGNITYSSLGYRREACFDAFMDNAQNKIQVSQ